MAAQFNPVPNAQALYYGALFQALQISIAYHASLKGSKPHKLIGDYRHEIDPTEWNESPLDLSYQMINWAMKRIHKNANVGWASNGHVARLLQPDEIPATMTPAILQNQVDNAIILDATLRGFPTIQGDKTMIVYHAESTYYNEKVAQMRAGDELVILPFLSTSINRYIAERFIDSAANSVWEIKVQPGQIFPYISESVPQMFNTNSGLQNEQEVLFPSHARLQLVGGRPGGRPGKEYYIHEFVLVGFAEKSPDFWNKTYEKLMGAYRAAHPEAEEESVAQSRGRRVPKKLPQYKYGGKSKASKTRKRTKRNRKSRRKVRK